MDDLLIAENLDIGYISHGMKSIIRSGLNINLKQGELTSLLGVNGMGKSTLLRTLAGFQPKLGGQIYINGKTIECISQANRAKLVSVVLTDRMIIGDLLVYEVVALGRYPYVGFFGGLSKKDEAIVEEMMESVGIASFASRKLSSLSDGERQKVMIAKALAQQTPVIILDEPTAFLDMPSRIEVTMLLRKLSDKFAKTVLLSTHDLDLALDLSDKLWIMGANNDFVSGVPEDLVLSGDFNRFFERDSVFFDKREGRFKLRISPTDYLFVDGDPCARYWVGKALHRNGFGIANSSADATKHIGIGRDGKRLYKLSEKGKGSIELKTINELLITLKN